MMRYLWLLLLAPGLAHAGSVAICDPDDAVVPYRVVDYKRSAHTPNWKPSDTVVVGFDPATLGVDRVYWKCSGGKVVAMTLEERSAVDAERQAAIDARTALLAQVRTLRGQLRAADRDWLTMTAAEQATATRRLIQLFLLQTGDPQ